jgi:hypothetical protein
MPNSLPLYQLSVFGAGSSIFAPTPTIRNPCAKGFRANFFAGFVLMTLVLAFHGVVLHGQLLRITCSVCWRLTPSGDRLRDEVPRAVVEEDV